MVKQVRKQIGQFFLQISVSQPFKGQGAPYNKVVGNPAYLEANLILIINVVSFNFWVSSTILLKLEYHTFVFLGKLSFQVEFETANQLGFEPGSPGQKATLH